MCLNIIIRLQGYKIWDWSPNLRLISQLAQTPFSVFNLPKLIIIRYSYSSYSNLYKNQLIKIFTHTYDRKSILVWWSKVENVCGTWDQRLISSFIIMGPSLILSSFKRISSIQTLCIYSKQKCSDPIRSARKEYFS